MFFQLGAGDRLEQSLSESGFVDAVSKRIDTVLDYDTPEDACGAAFAGGPVALAYSRFDDAVRAGAHEEYLASIEPYRAGHGYAIPGEFVVARAFRQR